jgi:hypothetical protein
MYACLRVESQIGTQYGSTPQSRYFCRPKRSWRRSFSAVMISSSGSSGSPRLAIMLRRKLRRSISGKYSSVVVIVCSTSGISGSRASSAESVSSQLGSWLSNESRLSMRRS